MNGRKEAFQISKGYAGLRAAHGAAKGGLNEGTRRPFEEAVQPAEALLLLRSLETLCQGCQSRAFKGVEGPGSMAVDAAQPMARPLWILEPRLQTHVINIYTIY